MGEDLLMIDGDGLEDLCVRGACYLGAFILVMTSIGVITWIVLR